MSDTLTQLIAKIQAQLLDDGTRFTTATCTAALRAALKDFNLAAPVHAGTLIDVVADQYEYELSDSVDAATAIEIIDILEADPDGGELDKSLDYDGYSEDERLFFRLRQPLDSGQIVARFTQPHTVSGLDSATESTLAAIWDTVLVDGACYHACEIRAVGRVETINLNRNVPDPLHKAAERFLAAFQMGLAQARKKRPQVGKPDERAWNDQWHSRRWEVK